MTTAPDDVDERAIIDMMDAFLQALLAVTWQNAQSDGLSHLRALHELAVQKINTFPLVFSTKQDRFVAVHYILNTLQKTRHQPAPDPAKLMLHRWTAFPTRPELAAGHRASADKLFEFTADLIAASRTHVTKGVARADMRYWVSGAIGAMAQDLRIPLLIPSLTDLVLRHATSRNPIALSVLRSDLSHYRAGAEQRLSEDGKRIIMAQIASELRWVAHGIDLQVDQSYSWDDLVELSKRTSGFALRVYAQFCEQGWIQEARFSSRRVRAKLMAQDEFESVFTPWFLRGSIFTMAGDDLGTRSLRRNIVDTERTDVRINGNRMTDSLVLVVPRRDSTFDLEGQLALLLLRLDKERRREEDRGMPSTFFRDLPPSLRLLAENGGIRRKIISSRKQLLFCLAELIAENIYQNRRHQEILLSTGKRVKTLADAYERTVELLGESGFQYTSESLRRGRAKFRREYLDRVPEIFGLADVSD